MRGFDSIMAQLNVNWVDKATTPLNAIRNKRDHEKTGILDSFLFSFFKHNGRERIQRHNKIATVKVNISNIDDIEKANVDETTICKRRLKNK